MEVNTFKKELLKINTDYIGKINQEKQIERIETVNALNELHPDYLKMSDSLKYMLIDEYMYLLSFYKDNEVLEILSRFHLTFFTPKVFIDYKSVLKSIQKHNADSSLLFPVETIFLAYNVYSRLIVKEAICNDLNIDYTKIAEKMNRQYKAGNSPKPLVDQIDFLKQVKKLLKEHKIHFRFKEQTPFTSISHEFKFSYKGIFRNLYDTLFELNKQIIPNFNQADLKVEFYDLLSLILRDKSILNINSESELLYGNPGNTRFKKKTIEYLFLR